VFADATARGLIADGAVDATGFDSRYASRQYVNRAGYKRFTRLAWPKLTVACHTGSRLLLAAVVGRGPSQDSPQFPAAPASGGC
jgi:hypothetical protein